MAFPIPNKSFRETFGRTLVEIGYANRNLVVIDTDLARSTRTIYFWREFPDRFIQVGISEQDAIGTAAGLAIGGKTPLVACYAMFVMRGWEQIRNTIARDNLNVKIVGTHSGLSDYLDGGSHQCFEDIALTRILPNFTVVAPSDTASTASLLKQIIDSKGPAYMRLGRDNAYDIYKDEDEVRLGKANILNEGRDIAIFTYGSMTGIVLETFKILRRRGIDPYIIDMHTLKPIDKDVITWIADLDIPIFTVEDHNIFGGLASIIADVLTTYKPSKIYRIGIEDRFGTGEISYERLLDYFKLTPKHIADKIEVTLNGL